MTHLTVIREREVRRIAWTNYEREQHLAAVERRRETLAYGLAFMFAAVALAIVFGLVSCARITEGGAPMPPARESLGVGMVQVHPMVACTPGAGERAERSLGQAAGLLLVVAGPAASSPK